MARPLILAHDRDNYGRVVATHLYTGNVLHVRHLTRAHSLGRVIDDYVDDHGLPDALVEFIYQSYIVSSDVEAFMDRMARRLPISELAFLYRYISIPIHPALLERRRIPWQCRRF